MNHAAVTNCMHCGVYLQGGATVHSEDCPFYPDSVYAMTKKKPKFGAGKGTLVEVPDAPLPDPFRSPLAGDDSRRNEPILFKGALVARFRVSEKVDPSELTAWIAKASEGAKANGVTNVHVKPFTEPVKDEFDEIVDYREFIGIYGDRRETESEFKTRTDRIVGEWQRDYENFLRKLMFYSSPMGRAQVAEVVSRNQRPINGAYPESKAAFRRQLDEFRKQFEPETK